MAEFIRAGYENVGSVISTKAPIWKPLFLTSPNKFCNSFIFEFGSGQYNVIASRWFGVSLPAISWKYPRENVQSSTCYSEVWVSYWPSVNLASTISNRAKEWGCAQTSLSRGRFRKLRICRIACKRPPCRLSTLNYFKRLFRCWACFVSFVF